MTDITELAQREKFEAWWERTQHNGNPPRFGWECWRDGEGYKVDDDDSELEGMWEAWKAAGAELVEALEKAKTERDEFRSRLKLERSILEDADKRIAELEPHKAALLKFIRESCYVFDGYDADISDAYIDAASSSLMPKIEAEPCHHCSGGSYSGLPGGACEHCMGTGLDNPAAELKSRTVTAENLQESAYRAGLTAGWNLGLTNNNDGFNKCLAAHAAGIKWEAE